MRRLLTPRWLARHLLMIVLVGACLGLGWWQIGRAIGGNALSFGYAIEWPVFALFVIFIWLHEVRAASRPGSGAEQPDGPDDPRQPGEVDRPDDAHQPSGGAGQPSRAAGRPTGEVRERAGADGEVARDPADVLLSSVPVRSRPPAQSDGDDPSLRAYNEYLAWLAADPTRRPGNYPA